MAAALLCTRRLLIKRVISRAAPLQPARFCAVATFFMRYAPFFLLNLRTVRNGEECERRAQRTKEQGRYWG